MKLFRGVSWVIATLACAACSAEDETILAESDDELHGALWNSFPILNHAGFASTFSTQGAVALNNEFFTSQGTNATHCAMCHRPESGWTYRPQVMELIFDLSDGLDPIFNPLNANNPAADLSTEDARRDAFSMLLRGLVRRGRPLVAGAEFEIIAVDDPHGFANATRSAFYRRPPATANIPLMVGVMWDDRLTVPGNVRAGITTQARGDIINTQLGAMPSTAVLDAIVDYESSLSVAQELVWGAGVLTRCGGRGGAEHLSSQALVAGRFDLYDAWIGLIPGACGGVHHDQNRAQIARGQEVFNGACNGCHNVANNGTNFAGNLFDIGTSAPAYRGDGLPLYTLRNFATGEVRETTDPGKGFVTGLWSDLNRFKVPTLRGIAARGPYFHNGIAVTLRDVVHFYEDNLGIALTSDQEDDLVAFLNAL